MIANFTQFLRRHSLVMGIFLMFLFTWTIDLANAGVLPFKVPFAVYILLGHGFFLAAVLMTWITLGREATVALLKRFLIWRVNWVWYLAALLLLSGLGLQLAWQYRADLLKAFPALQPLCDRIGCLPGVVRAPDRFSVVQRDIQPTANETGSLTLSAMIRNDAETAQPLPDIQLSLLDNNGGVLVRRRLMPDDYLFPAPPKEKVVTPGEVITITLDFEDPGYLATGFSIGFL
jgi:hypothetical protein